MVLPNHGLPWWLSSKQILPAMQEMREVWVRSLGQGSCGGGHSNTLQYSCWENPMDRGAWWSIVLGVTESRTQPKQLSN